MYSLFTFCRERHACPAWIIHPLLFERVMITLPLFFAARFALVAAAIFCVSPMVFFFSSFFAAFGFFSPRKALSAQSLSFTDLTTLAAFCLHRLFAFSRAVLPTLRGARSLEIRLKSILRSSILTASTRTSTRSPAISLAAGFTHQALPYRSKR